MDYLKKGGRHDSQVDEKAGSPKDKLHRRRTLFRTEILEIRNGSHVPVRVKRAIGARFFPSEMRCCKIVKWNSFSYWLCLTSAGFFSLFSKSFSLSKVISIRVRYGLNGGWELPDESSFNVWLLKGRWYLIMLFTIPHIIMFKNSLYNN